MNVDLSEVFFTKELQPPFCRQKLGAGSLAKTAMLSVSTEKSQRGISLDIVLEENKFSL